MLFGKGWYLDGPEESECIICTQASAEETDSYKQSSAALGDAYLPQYLS